MTFLRLLLAPILLLPGLAPAQPAGVSLPPGVQRVTSVEGVTEYRLANGLGVLLIPDRSIDTMTVNVTYLVGSRQEGYGETGMAHLLEHLMFRGTKRFPDIKPAFQQRGVRYNGSTSVDRTNYYGTFPASEKTLDYVLEVEADRMIHASIARKDLDAEMTIVRNEFESGENSASTVLRERAAASAFIWHITATRSSAHARHRERADRKLRAFYAATISRTTQCCSSRGRSTSAQHSGSRKSASARSQNPRARCAPPTPSSPPRTASAPSRCGAPATCRSCRPCTTCLRERTRSTQPWTSWSPCSITCLPGGCTRRWWKRDWRARRSAPSGSCAKPVSPTSSNVRRDA